MLESILASKEHYAQAQEAAAAAAAAGVEEVGAARGSATGDATGLGRGGPAAVEL